ncbi:MAG: DJ-1/PfpI family protein [Victivallales bacterium]|nr:DJ-1/PfpI family protein [Victivallales bacterium]MBT7302643.1 DJ-1/PfpI family protein [Victivallales bacterium]
MSVPSVVVCLAPGFEEIEAVTIIDVLRRGGVAVTTAGTKDEEWVMGAHDIPMRADACLADLSPADFTMAVLPGGMPGSANLRDSERVRSLVRAVWEQGGYAGAICAAPIALHAAGLLQGRRATSYPSFADQLAGAIYCEDEVVCDERIVTSRGPGTALAFSFRLLEELGLAEAADQLRQGMLAE